MTEQFRTRDCIILFKGDAYPVAVDSVLATNGWRGGQGVQWISSSRDEFLVTQSDGLYAGFTLWGSDESSDQFTTMTRNQPAYRFGTVGAGGWVIMTSTYEKYTYLSRQGPGPLVPITYRASDRLVFSLRGFWTNEITEWIDSGIPEYVARGLNTYYIGFVCQAPSAANDHYITIHTSI